MLKFLTGSGLAASGACLVFAVMATQPAAAHSRYKAAHWHRAHTVDIDAPFTRVSTRRFYSTAVDAPFASVRVHRRYGVWVRAPFVNLYIPR